MLKRSIVLFSVLWTASAAAQWQTPQYSVPIGRGLGVTGFQSAAPGAIGNVLTSNGAGANPSFKANSSGGGVVPVETCGAVGDGVTDDAPAIRTCMSQVNAAGGGTVGLSCNKTYLLGSKLDSVRIFRPYSNMTVQLCESATLKVANNMNTAITQFYVLYSIDDVTPTTNFYFKGGTIDFNGANNTCGGTCYYNNIGVGISIGSGITIEDTRFINNPGSQNIAINGFGGTRVVSNVLIKNTYHSGACDLVASNPLCTDHTAIFIAANGFILEANRCINATQSLTSTCWEQHGTKGTTLGVYVTKYSKFANIACILTTLCASDQLVIGANGDANYGITLWNDGTAGNLHDIKITASNFTQNAAVGSTAFHDWDLAVTATGAYNLFYDETNTFVSNVAAGSAGVVPAIRLGRSANQVVSGRFLNGLGPAIGNGSCAATTSFTVKGNIIIDAGQTSTAAGRRGILISCGATTIASANIGSNEIRNVNAAAYMTVGMEIVLNGTQGVVSNNNYIAGIAIPSSNVIGGNILAYIPAGVMYVRGESTVPGSTAAGTNNQLLMGNTGAAPSWLSTGTGCTTFLTTPSSANLRGCVTDETGTGALVFANTPTLVTPNIGAATGTSLNVTNNITSTGGLLSINGIGAFGAGGTGSVISQIFLDGGSGANGGCQFAFRKNSITVQFFGCESGIVGGGSTSNNFLLQMLGGFGSALRIDHATGVLSSLATTAATSVGTGGIVGSGGLGIAGAGWFGTYVATGVVAVASLPACGAGIKGARMFVNNATVTTFATTVAGGGANNVPVVCDGTNWIIGANDNVPLSDRRKFA